MLPALVLAALSAAACATTPGPGSAVATETDARSSIDGVWVHTEMPVRYRQEMTLATHGVEVRGEGTYRMEGRPEGTTTITGGWRRGVLTLYIVRDTGVRERWTGRLTHGRLRGELVFEDRGERQAFGFDRAGAVPSRG